MREQPTTTTSSTPGVYYERWEHEDAQADQRALFKLGRFLAEHGQRDRHESAVEATILWIKELQAEMESA